MPPKQLADLIRARGFETMSSFATALGYSATVANYFERGWFAPNHPAVPKAAELLGLSEPELRAFARKPEMTDAQMAICLFRLGKPRPVKEPGRALVRQRPKALVRVARASAPAQRNTILRMDKVARQTARSLATQASLLAMQGKKYMDVAVPVEGMAMILNDWFRLKGIPKQVVVDVDYEEIFG